MYKVYVLSTFISKGTFIENRFSDILIKGGDRKGEDNTTIQDKDPKV